MQIRDNSWIIEMLGRHIFALVACAILISCLTVSSAHASVAVTCTGTPAANTTTINNAIATAGAAGGDVVLMPLGICNVIGPITLNQSGVSIHGVGPGSSIINCNGTGTADCIQIGTFPSLANCVGASQPPLCQQLSNNGIYDIQVTAPNATGGALFDINGETQVTLSNIQAINGWDILYTKYVNTLVVRDMSAYSRDSSGYAVNFYNSITTGTSAGWYRSDAIAFNDVTINAQKTGGGCIIWDGVVYTVRMKHVALLTCNNGLVTQNSQQSASYFPAFLFAEDLEIDGTTGDGVLLNAGQDFHFVNSDIDDSNATCTSCYPFVASPDSNYSVTSNIWITGSSIHDGPEGAAYLNAADINVSGSIFSDTFHSGSSGAAISIASSAQDVLISGSIIGYRIGNPHLPSYGVDVNSGAARVSLTGNNYYKASSSSVHNGSSSAISFSGGIGYTGTAITVVTCAASSSC